MSDEKLKAEMARFATLTYEDFQRLAEAPDLTPAQRIGFPDAYRSGFEAAIVEDIIAKLAPLAQDQRVVFDIGCGCTDVPRLLAERCHARGSQLFLIDSAEQLARLPELPSSTKIAGRFPMTMAESVERYRGKVDAAIVYSVLHYIFEGGDLFGFLDAAVALLAPGGHLLLGDIPNVSKRKRFFSSETGVAFHQAFMKTTERPTVDHLALEPTRIDDGVELGIIMRYRAAGFEAYILPQPPSLPMSNRREDILIVRP